MIKVGISGKIASGKSEAEKIIINKGYLVFDLDKISHQLLENDKEVEAEILNKFNTTERKEIGEIVFNDANKKQQLENIIYPKLKKEILSLFDKHKNEKIIFISGALLFKSGFYKLFNKTIFIEANDSIRLERLIKRNNLSKKEALKRLNLQDDNINADFIIKNNDDIIELEEEIEKLLRSLTIS